MNILYALTAFPPSTGGAQMHFFEMAKRINQSHDVRVICHWRENRTDWLRGVTLRAPGDGQYEIAGVKVTQLNLTPSERQSLAPWIWSYYLTMGASVRRISDCLFHRLDAQVGKVDLVHAGRLGREFLAWSALRLARSRKVPFVLTPFHHPKWSGYRWRWYLKLYKEADAVLALTAAEKGILAGLGVSENKIHIVGHAPSLPEIMPKPGYFGPGGPVVLFLGQKYAYKGVDQILRSMPLVWRMHPDTRFAFIGPRTPYSSRLFRKIKDSRVIERDRVPEADKLAALADAAVFCLPSRQESFGGVFAEAWTLGKPVVGANVPAVAEIIRPGENGELVGASPAELAATLIELLRDPGRAEAYGKKGSSLVRERFTWEAVTARVEEVYRRLT